METRTYTEKSNARRAARAAGVDPTLIVETEDGFTFPSPVEPAPLAEKQRVVDAFGRAGTIVRVGPEQSEVRGADGKTRIEVNGHLKPDQSITGLDIPEFLKLSPEQRREEWTKNPPKAAAAKPTEAITMTKAAKGKGKNSKTKGASGADKTATLLSMLKGKGSTVEQLTKALDWLPHTLRARISRLPKDDKKIKIERERVDGVTSYRIAS